LERQAGDRAAVPELSAVRTARIALVAALAAVGLVVAPSAYAKSDTNFPPPGANDWSCRPSAAHPDPVVLVHGTGATMKENWGELSPILAKAGYCVFALNYGRRTDVPAPFTTIGGALPMEQSAVELGAFVDRVLATTGAAKVDIVGHSQGALMPDYYAKFLGGGPKIGRYVGMAPLWHGTNVAGLATLSRLFGGGTATNDAFVSRYCGACPEFLRGSPFIKQMNGTGGPRVAGIVYTTIMTTHDELVVPYTSGVLDGATNVVIQDLCPADPSEHVALAVDPLVFQLVLNALDPAHAKPVRCGLPVLGYVTG
jgi:pimeloyl-ACP methyl ester carboxylesterase